MGQENVLFLLSSRFHHVSRTIARELVTAEIFFPDELFNDDQYF